MNKQLLHQVANWLEAGAPHATFKMELGVYVETPLEYEQTADPYGADRILDRANECGTTCCIAGAALALANVPGMPSGAAEFNRSAINVAYEIESCPESSGILEGTESKSALAPSWYRTSVMARDLLGLDADTAQALFLAQGAGADLTKIDEAWAARCIRKLIATGEVDWEGTREA